MTSNGAALIPEIARCVLTNIILFLSETKHSIFHLGYIPPSNCVLTSDGAILPPLGRTTLMSQLQNSAFNNNFELIVLKYHTAKIIHDLFNELCAAKLQSRGS